MSQTITRRILTLKSRVGFGKYANEQLGRLIECDCAGWVRWIYYTSEAIDYTQEVKDAAQIYISIAKPGVDENARIDNERKVWAERKALLGDKATMGHVNHVRKVARIAASTKRRIAHLDGFGKANMQAVNHGRAYIKGR